MYRAPYYPQIQIEEKEARFGTVVTNYPNLYENPIKGKTIYKVDLLTCLKDLWGSNILMSRDYTYYLVSGNCSDEKYKSIIKSYYRKFIAFGNYINHIFIFGDKSIPYIRRIVEPARSLLNEYYDIVCEDITINGGKYLMRTNEYVYFAMVENVEFETSLEGVKLVC